MKSKAGFVILVFFLFGVVGVQASQFHTVDLIVYKQDLSGKEPGVRKEMIRKRLQSEVDNKEIVDLEFPVEEVFICRAHLNHRTGLVLELFRGDKKLAGFSTNKTECEFSFYRNEKSTRTRYIIEAEFSEGSIIPDRHIIGGEIKSD